MNKLIEKIKNINLLKREQHVMHVGVYRKPVIALWALLLCSLGFAIYKNFTAIDRHTVTKEKVVEMQLIDTKGVVNFVENFANVYYAWAPNKDSIQQRKTQLSQYVTEDVLAINGDDVRLDIPTSSTLQNIQIWTVTQLDESTYRVRFEVRQTIKEQDKSVNNVATYTTKVHVEKNGDMVIVQLPTIAPPIKKSNFKQKVESVDTNVEASEQTSATTFLETFFKLYPKADTTELSYYVTKNQMLPIHKDYVFAGIDNPIFSKVDKDALRVLVNVRYIDTVTKAMQISQYDLVLIKVDGNYKINKVA